MRLQVIDLIGENCVTADAGEQLYSALAPALQTGVVDLDFGGCRVFASPFFNASVGRLVGTVAGDVLRTQLRFENLTPEGEHLLRRVIDNSRQYYARNPDQRRLYDEVVNAVPSER